MQLSAVGIQFTSVRGGRELPVLNCRLLLRKTEVHDFLVSRNHKITSFEKLGKNNGHVCPQKSDGPIARRQIFDDQGDKNVFTSLTLRRTPPFHTYISRAAEINYSATTRCTFTREVDYQMVKVTQICSWTDSVPSFQSFFSEIWNPDTYM